MDVDDWFEQVPALRDWGPVDVESVKRRVAIETRAERAKSEEAKHTRLNALATEIIISMDMDDDYACACSCCFDDDRDIYPA